MNKREILNELLKMLTTHLKLHEKFGDDYEIDRRLFRAICNVTLSLNGIDERFYLLQDELLSLEREEKGVVDINKLKFENNISLFKGDITRLNADAIVNAANEEYLGCFIPLHNCIDNIIMSASGFQMREELLKQRGNGESVKVTKGYNLPCKFVFHVAGPEIITKVSTEDEKKLASCYENCLKKAVERNLKSIAFCCISTGVYSFPNDLACKIAVKTVKEFLKTHNIKVVFDVFKDYDEVLYEKELQ